jgi:glucuronate isomerase
MQLDPDRLLPSDPATRRVARRLYEQVAELPIISPHGHVNPALLLDNQPFTDPAELFIAHDHYVTRLMHAAGLPLAELGLPDRTSAAPVASPRAAWRTFCAHWYLFAGTASGYWLQTVLVDLFGLKDDLCAENARCSNAPA